MIKSLTEYGSGDYHLPVCIWAFIANYLERPVIAYTIWHSRDIWHTGETIGTGIYHSHILATDISSINSTGSRIVCKNSNQKQSTKCSSKASSCKVVSKYISVSFPKSADSAGRWVIKTQHNITQKLLPGHSRSEPG